MLDLPPLAKSNFNNHQVEGLGSFHSGYPSDHVVVMSSPPRATRNNSFDSLRALEETAIDELLSLGSAGGISSPNNSRAHTSGDNAEDDDSIYWRLANPVHMELQENAKLPTFNWNVDRTGSGVDPWLQNPHSRTFLNSSDSKAAVEEEVPTSKRTDANSHNINLGEIFLQSSGRRSYSAAFEHAGALQGETGNSRGNSRKESVASELEAAVPPISLVHDPLAEALANVDPTPLSEIRKRVERKNNHWGHPARARPVPLPVPGTLEAAKTDAPNTVEASSAPNYTDALATAAAIASTQGVTNTRPSSAQGQSKYNAPQPATRHMAVQETNRHGHYDFGIKHAVASVPVARKAKIPSAVALTKPTSASTTKNHPVVPTTQSSINNGSSNNTGTAAYERKKQRAKDARVKLNESIDHLSIAINLAGTQSKQRLETSATFATTEPLAQASTTMRECMRHADQAKKWDRPSFVGTAATMIQSLNAQCEALMREVVYWRGSAAQATATTAVSSVASSEKRTATTSPVEEGVSAKRPKLESNGVATTANSQGRDPNNLGSVLGQTKILERIALFLDPQSLVRCHSACRSWNATGAFSGESIWETYVLRRFGFYNVRQWRGRIDDDEQKDGLPTPSMTLYANMDAANVMPHFSADGMLLLGEARLPGRVSAWTFMVERSNGETLRSVRRQEQTTSIRNSLSEYSSLPVVELRTVIQNTCMDGQPLVLRKQNQTVDTSTRRRSDEMREIDWDDRFQKRIVNLDGSPRPNNLNTVNPSGHDFCSMDVFEVIVIVSYIHAKGCSTTSKFIQRSNFTKILVQFSGNGTTVPIVVPFPRDAVALHH